MVAIGVTMVDSMPFIVEVVLGLMVVDVEAVIGSARMEERGMALIGSLVFGLEVFGVLEEAITDLRVTDFLPKNRFCRRNEKASKFLRLKRWICLIWGKEF